jgi:RNA polymerase sigma-70 factor (ECF subfamily)
VAAEMIAAERRMALPAETFDALVERSQKRVYRIIHALVHDGDAAASLTQDAFLRAYRAFPSFRGDAAAETWLVSIALNVARDHLRSQRQSFWRRLVRGADHAQDASVAWSDPSPSAERSLLAREDVARVFARVGSLSPPQREAFVLRFVDERTVAEIASVLGVTEGTVKVHLHRATTAVRQSLKEPR